MKTFTTWCTIEICLALSVTATIAGAQLAEKPGLTLDGAAKVIAAATRAPSPRATSSLSPTARRIGSSAWPADLLRRESYAPARTNGHAAMGSSTSALHLSPRG